MNNEIKECPKCNSKELNVIDSSENLAYDPPEFIKECSEWKEWECCDCGLIIALTDGEIETTTQEEYWRKHYG